MKIVTNDKKGVGQEKGVFVYTFLDIDGDSDGFRIVTDDDFKPDFLCEHDLISIREDNSIDFYNTRRNMLDDLSGYKVGILSKVKLYTEIRLVIN